MRLALLQQRITVAQPGRIRDCQRWWSLGEILVTVSTNWSLNLSSSSMMFGTIFAVKWSWMVITSAIWQCLLPWANLSVRPLEAINLIRNNRGRCEYRSDDRASFRITALSMDGRLGNRRNQRWRHDRKTAHDGLISRSARNQRSRCSRPDLNRTVSFLALAAFWPVLCPSSPSSWESIAENTKAKGYLHWKRFRQNMAPAGKMTLQEQLEWCERTCKARKIDVVLGNAPHPELEGLGTASHFDLASPNRDWRHDRLKLQQAIQAQLA